MKCPHCEFRFSVTDSVERKRIRCPSCQAAIPVRRKSRKTPTAAKNERKQTKQNLSAEHEEAFEEHLEIAPQGGKPDRSRPTKIGLACIVVFEVMLLGFSWSHLNGIFFLLLATAGTACNYWLFWQGCFEIQVEGKERPRTLEYVAFYCITPEPGYAPTAFGGAVPHNRPVTAEEREQFLSRPSGYVSTEEHIATVTAGLAGIVVAIILAVVVFGIAPHTKGGLGGGGGGQVVGKSCTNCGESVPVSSSVGDRCPNCGVVWRFEKR